MSFSPSQNLYRSLYTTLSLRKRAGADGNQDSDNVRRRLWETWMGMIKREREPFLAPGCLERRAMGPIFYPEYKALQFGFGWMVIDDNESDNRPMFCGTERQCLEFAFMMNDARERMCRNYAIGYKGLRPLDPSEIAH